MITKKSKELISIQLENWHLLFIKDNVFVFNNKIYQQTIGGAMGSSFTLTLANIFMWHWQQKFVLEQATTGEFYGR